MRIIANFRRSPLLAGLYFWTYLRDRDNLFSSVLLDSRRKDRYVARFWVIGICFERALGRQT